MDKRLNRGLSSQRFALTNCYWYRNTFLTSCRILVERTFCWEKNTFLEKENLLSMECMKKWLPLFQLLFDMTIEKEGVITHRIGMLFDMKPFMCARSDILGLMLKENISDSLTRFVVNLSLALFLTKQNQSIVSFE